VINETTGRFQTTSKKRRIDAKVFLNFSTSTNEIIIKGIISQIISSYRDRNDDTD
jgi:hypothetical protein